MTTTDDPARTVAPATTGRAGGRHWCIYLDLPGRVTGQVARDAPTAPQLRGMFRCFVTDRPPRAARRLEVTAPFEPVADAADLDTTLHYTEDVVTLPDARVQVVKDPSGYRLHGRGELLTSALPLVDALMVTTGAAMFHAATIDYRGQGIALPAAGGTGKTSTIAKFSRLDGVSFMGDDWAFLTSEGSILGFAKPMFIKPHHRDVYPHLFRGSRKPLVPVSLSRPVASLTTVVHPVVARYPRAAALSRRWSPEHRMVTPEQALGSGCVSTRAPLTVAVFVERYSGERTRVMERSASWLASRMLGNFHIELPRQSQQLLTAMGATGLLPLDRFVSQKSAVLRAALEGVPTYLMQVPSAMSPDAASDAILASVQRVLGEDAR